MRSEGRGRIRVSWSILLGPGWRQTCSAGRRGQAYRDRRHAVHSGKTRRFLMTDSDAAGLEARFKIVEDKLAIYEVIASHPPSADTGSADYTSSVYLEGGVFDRGPTPAGATGVENIVASTPRPAHE